MKWNYKHIKSNGCLEIYFYHQRMQRKLVHELSIATRKKNGLRCASRQPVYSRPTFPSGLSNPDSSHLSMSGEHLRGPERGLDNSHLVLAPLTNRFPSIRYSHKLPRNLSKLYTSYYYNSLFVINSFKEIILSLIIFVDSNFDNY